MKSLYFLPKILLTCLHGNTSLCIGENPTYKLYQLKYKLNENQLSFFSISLSYNAQTNKRKRDDITNRKDKVNKQQKRVEYSQNPDSKHQ